MPSSLKETARRCWLVQSASERQWCAPLLKSNAIGQDGTIYTTEINRPYKSEIFFSFSESQVLSIYLYTTAQYLRVAILQKKDKRKILEAKPRGTSEIIPTQLYYK